MAWTSQTVAPSLPAALLANPLLDPISQKIGSNKHLIRMLHSRDHQARMPRLALTGSIRTALERSQQSKELWKSVRSLFVKGLISLSKVHLLTSLRAQWSDLELMSCARASIDLESLAIQATPDLS